MTRSSLARASTASMSSAAAAPSLGAAARHSAESSARRVWRQSMSVPASAEALLQRRSTSARHADRTVRTSSRAAWNRSVSARQELDSSSSRLMRHAISRPSPGFTWPQRRPMSTSHARLNSSRRLRALWSQASSLSRHASETFSLAWRRHCSTRPLPGFTSAQYSFTSLAQGSSASAAGAPRSAAATSRNPLTSSPPALELPVHVERKEIEEGAVVGPCNSPGQRAAVLVNRQGAAQRNS